MKKLLVMLAIACAAFASQAAVTAWGWTSVQATIDGGSPLTGVLAQLYVVNDSGDDILISSATTKAAPAAQKGKVTLNTYDQTVNWGDTVNGVTINGSAEIYVKVFNAATEAAATYAIVSQSMTLGSTGASETSVGSADFSSSLNFSAEKGSGAYAWTAVPEPTSGLLMLVGLGALALRRRRA